MKILLAIDGSPCSMAAVEAVARNPWPADAEVRLLTVDPPLGADLRRDDAPLAVDQLIGLQRASAVKRLNDATALLTQLAPGLKVTPTLREGWPKEVILDEAERWGADLVVVGAHGYGRVKRLLFGSVSSAVATRAPCSVLIVREKASPSEGEVEAAR